MTEWKTVARALLGSWPSQVASWGESGIAAFVEELQARGVSADQALTAIRSHSGKFPPSAGELTGAARRDPGTPTFEEFFELAYGPRGFLKSRPLRGDFGSEAEMERAREAQCLERARGLHPLVGEFAARYGVRRLRMLELDDPSWGEQRKRELRDAWARTCEALEGREVAALAAGRREGLRAFDPLAVLDRPVLESGTGAKA